MTKIMKNLLVCALNIRTILELLAREDEALLVRRDALLVLNFGLHVVDGIACFDLIGTLLPSQEVSSNI